MRKVLWGTLALLLLAGAIWAGVWVRWSVWEWTKEIRFVGDINNGFNHGKRAYAWGYLNVYERLKPEPGNASIDYAPFRLGLMTLWMHWLKEHDYPTGDYREKPEVQTQRDYHAPLLNFNLAMELLSAAGAALLVWHVRRRAVDPSQRTGAAALAIGAALLVWFNPASLQEAHAWPQWDVWPMPFFLFALYCGFRRWWLAAGLLIGLGSMLKGQILMVGWTIPLWAICVGDWRGAVRVVVGIAGAILLVGSPWALSNYDEATKLRNVHTHAIGLTLLAAIATALVPRRFSPTLVCAAIALSLFVSMRWLGGTDYWYRSAFDVGTWHFNTMRMGPTSNLPAIMADRWEWRIDDVLFTLPAIGYRNSEGVEGWRIGGAITIRTMMLTIFFTLSAACAVRAAFLDRARDARALVALSLPWLLFFVIPCQVHERYLVFVSMSAATWVACGAGVTLLGVVITVVAWIHIMLCMMQAGWGSLMASNNTAAIQTLTTMRQWIEPTHPGIAWLLLLASAVLLYNILVPARRPAVVEPVGTEPVA